MAPSVQQLGVGLVAGGALWKGWHALVLRKAAKSMNPWGPRWFAIPYSGLFDSFMKRYLTFTHNTEEKIREGVLGPDKQYVIVWHPHGAFTIGSLAIAHWWAKSYPMPRLSVVVADVLLGVPGLAEFLLLCNARSQDAKTFDALLAKGQSVAVQPGGILEQVNTDHEKEKIFFPPRLGFIRLAIKHGTPLLPIYFFGENQMYNTSPAVSSVNKWLYNKFRIGTLFVKGRLGLLTSPLLPTPLLLPALGAPLHLRFGDPVPVGPPNDDPTEETVREVLRRYTEAVQKIFDENKDTCLPPEVAARGLEVIVRSAERSRM
eukprot:TRINITY_DN9204_c0_g1_i1.p1 TRINITY_DN9204_c0_g1~~TRINITY_DN9204_c0_g1_i1.p1  ORF type:complete len:352 (-),score=36.02 TRINITY_DN9204_c0_g1_i1:123-1073(-)